jgi:hypothetical protein
MPDLPAGALVLLAGEPGGYLAAVAPAQRYVQLDGLTELGRPARHLGRLQAALASGTPAYAVAREPAAMATRFPQAMSGLEQCRHVCTNWVSGGVGPALCPLGGSPAPAYRGPAANALCAMAGGEFGSSGRRGLALPAKGGTLHLPQGCTDLWLRTNPGGAALLRAAVPAGAQGAESHGGELVRLALAPGTASLLLADAPGLLLRAARCGLPPG